MASGFDTGFRVSWWFYSGISNDSIQGFLMASGFIYQKVTISIHQKVAIRVDDGSRDGERRPGDGGEERDIDTHGRRVYLQHSWSQDFLMVSGFIYLMVSGFRKP